MKKNRYYFMIAAAVTCITMAGCSDTSTAETMQNFSLSDNAAVTTAAGDEDQTSVNTLEYSTSSEQFSSRDMEQSADLSNAKYISAENGKSVDITEEGVYVLSGSAENFTLKVDAGNEAKVQIVLDGANITNDSFPVIYVVSSDKCFVTTASDSTLSVTGEFRADGDTNTDAVIFSKDDITFNGEGTLNITSVYGNGISGKDDVKFTGGTYNIKALKDAAEANDSIRICGGTYNITSDKDAFRSENDQDGAKGYIYISGGDFRINAASDGIQAATTVQIDGGSFDITSAEGIEGSCIQINGGEINITASDDGINATDKSGTNTLPSVEFNGGHICISMAQGDTDAIDSNGSITVNDGTIEITASTSSFDYDTTAEFNGGTIIINGEEVSEIPQSMMGGRGGFGNMGRGNFENGEMPRFENGQNREKPQFGDMQNNKNFDGTMPENGRGGRHNIPTEENDQNTTTSMGSI